MNKEDIMWSLIDVQSKYIELLDRGYSEIIGLAFYTWI